MVSSVVPGPTGWVTESSSVVQVSAEDASDIDTIEYRSVDGHGWTQWFFLSDHSSGGIQFNQFPGVHELEFRATDVAGNVSAVVPYTHRVDYQVSGATVSGFPGSFDLGESYELFYTCSDHPSGVAECSSSNGASGQPLPTDTKGEFTFTLTNRDNAGNEKITTWSYTVGADTCPGS